MSKRKLKKIFLVMNALCILFFIQVQESFAANEGDLISFNVEENYDISARSKVQAELIKSSTNVYFYVEKEWWNLQNQTKQGEILLNLDILSSEFTNRIYPISTSLYGSEWIPGVDGDPKISIFFHSMKEGVGGYFRSADEYLKIQAPSSNEREMIYINLLNISDSMAKTILAHEFVHLINYNQKERLRNAQEETWLNEARADYIVTILGYNDFYEGSRLQTRVRDFLQDPTDSLTEWKETKSDYAVVNLFMHYLVDHYGVDILSTSMKSKLTGIPSINEALYKKGTPENFGQIFTNWQIALFLNDCSLDSKYCYLNQNLRKFKINPTLNFLPLSGNSSLSVANITKNWSGNWQKIIGGNGGDLKLSFSSLSGLNYSVPYIVFDKDNNYSVYFLNLNENEQGETQIKDFGTKNVSLIILPSLQSKISGFNGSEPTFPYSFTASVASSISDRSGEKDIIQKLLDQISSLKKQIEEIKKSLGQSTSSCSYLNNNMSIGSRNDDVICLQEFLKNQGQDIYPEGLVTGYFGNLTRLAVIRFQQKYNIPNTGFVGPLTRNQINQLL